MAIGAAALVLALVAAEAPEGAAADVAALDVGGGPPALELLLPPSGEEQLAARRQRAIRQARIGSLYTLWREAAARATPTA